MKYDWVGKVIHWELCKKLKLCHTNKPEAVLKNEMYEILWDLINKKKRICQQVDFATLADHREKKI